MGQLGKNSSSILSLNPVHTRRNEASSSDMDTDMSGFSLFWLIQILDVNQKSLYS